jgi:hypothetical protein
MWIHTVTFSIRERSCMCFTWWCYQYQTTTTYNTLVVVGYALVAQVHNRLGHFSCRWAGILFGQMHMRVSYSFDPFHSHKSCLHYSIDESILWFESMLDRFVNTANRSTVSKLFKILTCCSWYYKDHR